MGTWERGEVAAVNRGWAAAVDRGGRASIRSKVVAAVTQNLDSQYVLGIIIEVPS